MKKGYNLVTGTFKHSNAELIDLEFANNEIIASTKEHPFWSLDRKKWVDAIDLKENENVLTLQGKTSLLNTTKRSGKFNVYNLEVHKSHTFFVGKSGIWVHNALYSKGDFKMVNSNYLKQKGIDAHAVKKEIVGNSNLAHYDLYKGPDGFLYLFLKGGKGEGINTYYTID